MKSVTRTLSLALAVCSAGNGQPPASPKVEFDAAAINIAAPQAGHFRAAASSKGGPGTPDPTWFHCSNCNLAFLIAKAFELQRYQFPGQSSLPATAFDVSARVPEGTNAEQFAGMLQNLLKDRFGLSYRFEKRQIQGYDLVVARSGPKLKESQTLTNPALAEWERAREEKAGMGWHGSRNDGGHEHTRTGLTIFNGQARYRGDRQSIADLARMIANQLEKPVDDHTGLQGTYDIDLSWSDDGSHAASHFADGGGDHGGLGGASPGSAGSDVPSGQTLIGALQAQLGLKLETRKATADIFIVDRIEKSPAAN